MEWEWVVAAMLGVMLRDIAAVLLDATARFMVIVTRAIWGRR